MRLVRAEVSKFKSITESTAFDVDPMVTALVGKNEAGKTAVLQAMYRLKPIASGHPTDFEELRDYPRRSRMRDRASISTMQPVSLTFEIDQEDREALSAKFGDGALTRNQVVVRRRYGNSSTFWESDLADQDAILRHLVEKADLDPEKYVKATLPDTVRALEDDKDVTAAIKLGATLRDRNLEKEVRLALAARLPRFQYFDEYNALPGSVSIRRLQNVDEADLTTTERTALSLLRLAGVESDEFSETDYEPRKAALEAAANEITEELFRYWSQNTDLSVELDIEFRPIAAQAPETEPWLQIRVRNQRHRVTLNMLERSKGFIWFFSFLLAFSEYAGEEKRIILLDEPGSNLHATAQSDLLRYIDERIAPFHQVLYSTHSLFMIDPAKLERCRVVEDLDNVGTTISDRIWAAHPDTFFPIVGALAVGLTHSLVTGPDQLLVQGPSDAAYLTVMSQVVKSAGGTGLDPRWTITPAGGLEKVPAFLALLGANDDGGPAVLIDGFPQQSDILSDLVGRGMLDSHRLISVSEIVDSSSRADLEDLFTPSWYLTLLSESGVGSVPKSEVGKGPVVEQAEGVLGVYDRYQPASFLLRSPGSLLDKVDEATRGRFEQLFVRLNSLLT